MNRFLSMVSIFFVASFVYAQKKDLALPTNEQYQPGLNIGFAQIAQLVLAIGIVVGLLKFALPRVVPMLNKRLKTSALGGIKIEESASFSSGTLYIISARGKSVLVCCSGQTVQTLMELSSTDPTTENTPAFFEILDKAAENPVAPTHAVVSAPRKNTVQNLKPEQLDSALDRLNRLLR